METSRRKKRKRLQHIRKELQKMITLCVKGTAKYIVNELVPRDELDVTRVKLFIFMNIPFDQPVKLAGR